MRMFVFGMVCFLALSVSAFATEELYIIVGDTAPTTDVITAANFAGFMAQNGYIFQSKLASQNPDSGFLVFIDGDTAYLSGEFSRKNIVVAYFEAQEMRVKERSIPQKEPVIEEEMKNVIVKEVPIEEPIIIEPESVQEPVVQKKKNIIARFFSWLFG